MPQQSMSPMRRPPPRRLLLLFFAACCLIAGLQTHVDARGRQANSAPDADHYVLAPNDKVRVKVYGEPDISDEYEVNSSGIVSIPLAGHLRAAGLTTRQLEHAITSALSKGFVRNPKVNVEISNYRPYYILGEVKKSGEYPYKSGLTVMDAVASAGGYTYRANENKVYVRPSGGGSEQIYSLESSVPIHPGDNIRVPERYF